MLQQRDRIFVKSYRYLRLAMVTLLGALFAAVLYQTMRQDFDPLESVSAYYYTPAQALFVSGLIGFAACMIALKGTTDVEDISLNLAGMFAIVVALVPTSRGADFDAAVDACQEQAGLALTEEELKGSDCASKLALVDAAKANIENNMIAVLTVGVVVAIILAIRGFLGRGPFSWPAFGAGVALLVVGAVAFFWRTDWFARNAHWIAAAGLFACIFVVGIVNARRQRGEERRGGAPTEEQKRESPRQRVIDTAGQTASTLGITRRGPRNWYAWIALIMLGTGGIAVYAWQAAWISLFLLEVWVFVLFIAFWIAQTIEQGNKPPGSEPIKPPAPAPTGSVASAGPAS